MTDQGNEPLYEVEVAYRVRERIRFSARDGDDARATARAYVLRQPDPRAELHYDVEDTGERVQFRLVAGEAPKIDVEEIHARHWRPMDERRRARILAALATGAPWPVALEAASSVGLDRDDREQTYTLDDPTPEETP